jgi:DNA-binding MarR family transcriptional regulator
VSTPKIPGAPFSDEELAAWHGMLTLYSRVMRDLDRDLMDAHQISVREFDVLITLSNAPQRRLRMTELADHILLSPSGLSRLVDRLERMRLVRRASYEDDARGIYAVLTGDGEARLDEARATHNAVIRTRFTDHLSPDDLSTLGAIWRKVTSSGG